MSKDNNGPLSPEPFKFTKNTKVETRANPSKKQTPKQNKSK